MPPVPFQPKPELIEKYVKCGHAHASASTSLSLSPTFHPISRKMEASLVLDTMFPTNRGITQVTLVGLCVATTFVGITLLCQGVGNPGKKMHHALQIQEILLDIFDRCYGGYARPEYTSLGYPDLAALARTCRAFKEPALDLLWEILPDFSPLARCLPEASERLSEDKYSFRRPLTEAEWCTLRDYTRRIRRIDDLTKGLDEGSFIILYNPPTTESLFPKLCCLQVDFGPNRVPPLNMFYHPFPSLTFIRASSVNAPDWFRDALESLLKFSQNITTLKLFGIQDAAFDKFVSRCICRWKNIHHLICPDVALDANALSHLSHITALTCVCYAQSPALPAFDSPLLFPNLTNLRLRSQSLESISQLLFQIQLPILTEFVASIRSSTSRARLSTFFDSSRTSINGHVICLDLYSTVRAGNVLTLQDLEPCLTFSNLQMIRLEIGWDVGLRDSDLLALASVWPHLITFSIGERFGWNGAGGITPNGLSALLEMCQSLTGVALAMDTGGYVEVPERGLLESLTCPRTISLDVLDTIIDVESVPALAKLFEGTPQFSVAPLMAWHNRQMVRSPEYVVQYRRWGDVRCRARR